MKLQDLFSKIPAISSRGLTEQTVTGIFNDARQVIPGGVFVAVKGHSVDGHSFLSQALAKGAIAFVVTDIKQVPERFQGGVLEVQDSRMALDKLSGIFYGFPADKLYCVGITGTNGKTSVSYMVESILNAGGMPTGVIGTVNHHLGSIVWPSNMTTPDPIFLQKRLREFLDHGAKAVVLEVSSHALDQKRVESVPFDAVVFTNLTRDHLDYHLTMENYFQAKQRLTTDMLDQSSKKNLYAVINGDDEYGAKLKVSNKATAWKFGSGGGDLHYQIESMDFALTTFNLKTPRGEIKVKLPMSGEHNVQNAVAAIGVGLAAGLSLDVCAKAMSTFSGVPGRMQSVPNEKSVAVFVDYAHTPDALENVLMALQKIRQNIKSQGKIWTVFGCGGDRDKGKRPMMATTAEKLSDHVVVTSDNPRTEVPEEIIKDIMLGFSDPAKVQIFVDRNSAIQNVIQSAQIGDVVLIAGKGHEDYQIIGTTKHHFSDVEAALAALKGRT